MNLKGDRADVKATDWPYNLLTQVMVEPNDPLDHLTDEAELCLAMCMCRLTETEKRVLWMRYFEQKTLPEVGEAFSVTRERIRQVEAKAIRKLRHPSCSYILKNGVKAYIDKRVNEKVTEVLKIREAEMNAELREKMADVVIRDDEDKRTMIAKLKATTIDELSLSLRPCNCLKRQFVHTVGDLIDRYPTYEQFITIRNLGRKSAEEVIERVQELGFNWPVYGGNEDR